MKLDDTYVQLCDVMIGQQTKLTKKAAEIYDSIHRQQVEIENIWKRPPTSELQDVLWQDVLADIRERVGTCDFFGVPLVNGIPV